MPALVYAGTLSAQDLPASREDELSRAQKEKAEHVAKPTISRDEEQFQKFVSKPLASLFTPKVGWTVRVGGLMTGSGFGLGPMYSRPDLMNERLDFKFSIAGSFRQYWATALQLAMPHLGGDRFRADLYARHSDSNAIEYYGSGPNSRKEDRTRYRQEDTSVDGRLAWRPDRRKSSIGVYGGFLAVNVGPGRDNAEAPSTETRFTPSQAPGIHEQSNFVRYGPYAEFNNLDKPGDPHRGGNYQARLLFYDDVDVNRYAFRRFDAWTEQYIPFCNEKRVIALHAMTSLSWTKPGQVVPFYLQPTLGDAADLRGYPRFRYRDNNSLVLSSEYRWEVMPGFDMALFVDAGRVFAKPGDLSLNNLRYDGGFGFRFKTRDAVVMRIDTGFSREGFSIWFKFSDVYSRNLFRYLF